MACDLGAAKLFFVLKLEAFAIGGPGLPGAVGMQRRRGGLGS